MGNKFPQSAMFHCKTCGENLSFGFAKNHSLILVNIGEIEENLQLPAINLHPELPIDASKLSDPSYFPSLDFLSAQMEKGDEGFIEMRLAQASVTRYIEKWDKIHQDFRYLKEDRWQMLEKQYGKNNGKTEKEILKNVLNAGRYYLEGNRWKKLYRDTLAELEKAKRHSEFSELKAFLIDYKKEFLLQKMYAVMDKYREVEIELLPTLLSQKCDLPLTGLSSSPDWKKISKVYGELYEIYGDLLLIPSTINNLLVRNDFEKFATVGFTIDKYKDTDKAGRANNFITNTNLKALQDFYDGGIRNSTHHEAYTFEIEDQNIIMRTGKGGKIEKTLPLMNYIVHCNELYARCLILFNIFFKIIS